MVVQPGDTLVSLSQRVYGSGSYWYVLAEANGYDSPDSALPEGLSLRAPQVTVTRNDSGTFRPFNAMETFGPNAPTLSYIAPGPNGCEQAVKQVVVLVIAAVITFYLGPQLGAKFGAWGYAAAGAVGSVASQTAGTMMGLQDGIDWGQVGISALTAGATGGSSNAWVDTLKGVATDAVVGKLQGEAFSWRAVAASVIGNYAGQKIGGALGKNASTKLGQAAAQFVGSAAGGMVTQHAKKQWGEIDRINYTAVAIGAVASTLTGALTGQHAARAAEVRALERQAEKRAESQTYLAMKAKLNEANAGVAKQKTLAQMYNPNGLGFRAGGWDAGMFDGGTSDVQTFAIADEARAVMTPLPLTRAVAADTARRTAAVAAMRAQPDANAAALTLVGGMLDQQQRNAALRGDFGINAQLNLLRATTNPANLIDLRMAWQSAYAIGADPESTAADLFGAIASMRDVRDRFVPTSMTESQYLEGASTQIFQLWGIGTDRGFWPVDQMPSEAPGVANASGAFSGGGASVTGARQTSLVLPRTSSPTRPFDGGIVPKWDLESGRLPGVNPVPGRPIGMPASSNPDRAMRATLEEFAAGRDPVEPPMPVRRGKGVMYTYQEADGSKSYVTIGPAGSGGDSTDPTTATLEINVERFNRLNPNASGDPTRIKLKFPMRADP